MTCGDRMPRQAAEGPSSLPEGGHSNAAFCRYGVVLRWASARMTLSTPSPSSRIQTTIILVWSSELPSIHAIGSSLSNRHAPLLLHDAGGSARPNSGNLAARRSSRIAATMSGEACEGIVVVSRCQTATACTPICVSLPNIGRRCIILFASRPPARPCTVGYAPHRCPSGPPLDSEMGRPSTAINLTVMPEHRWAFAGLRGGRTCRAAARPATQGPIHSLRITSDDGGRR
jgi:hypothetical protein